MQIISSPSGKINIKIIDTIPLGELQKRLRPTSPFIPSQPVNKRKYWIDKNSKI